jgi:predicted deacylase
MRHALLSRAIDADYVFDIHCDDDAVMHIYTTPSAWPDLRDLVDYLECPLVLLAQISGGNPFDEACSSLWSNLTDTFPDVPIPTGCVATTIELRGQADVSEKLACQDARALYSFMLKRGILTGDAPDVTQAEVAVHPLEGLARIKAPCTGVVTLQIQPGQWVESGQILATVYPLEEDALPVNVESPIAGLAFSRRIGRYVQAGLKIATVSGAKAMPVKPGQTLLSD